MGLEDKMLAGLQKDTEENQVTNKTAKLNTIRGWRAHHHGGPVS